MANTDYTQSLSNIQHSIEELSREVACITDDSMGLDDTYGNTPNSNLGIIAQSLYKISASLKQFNRMYAMVNSEDLKYMETLLGIKGEEA